MCVGKQGMEGERKNTSIEEIVSDASRAKGCVIGTQVGVREREVT